MLPKGAIALASLRTSVVLAARMLVQAGALLLLAHMLGPARFGAFAAVVAIAALHGVIATFGTHLTLLRDLSQDPGKRTQALPAVLGTTRACSTVLLVMYLAVCFVALEIDTVPAVAIIAIGISEIVLQPFLLIASSERHAKGQIASSQIIVALPQTLRLAAIAALMWMAPADLLTTYAIAHLVAIGLVLAGVLMTSRQRWPAPSGWQMPPLRLWRENLGYAVMCVTGTAPGELDKALAAQLLPLGTAGIYSAASRVVGAIVVPVTAAVLSALPRLFRTNSHSGMQLQHWLLGATLVYGLIAGAFVWFAAPAIHWLFGAAYDGINDVARILALAVPGMCLRFASMNILTTLERPWTRITIELLGLALLAIAAYAWTPAHGQWGFLAAVVTSEWAIALLGLVTTHVCRRASGSPLHHGRDLT